MIIQQFHNIEIEIKHYLQNWNHVHIHMKSCMQAIGTTNLLWANFVSHSSTLSTWKCCFMSMFLFFNLVHLLMLLLVGNPTIDPPFSVDFAHGIYILIKEKYFESLMSNEIITHILYNKILIINIILPLFQNISSIWNF